MSLTEREIGKFRSITARALQTSVRCITLTEVTHFEDDIYFVRVLFRGKFPYCFLIKQNGYGVLKWWREIEVMRR